VKASSGQVFICHGFNNYFEPPKFIGEHLVMLRTAVVIKKRDFYDEWDVYDDLFWRMVVAMTTEMADAYRIKVTDQTAPAFNSISELRAWQALQKETDSEFVPDPPAEIDLISAGTPICHMEFEDWSDIGKVEPYSCSYTFSFYSHDVNVNEKIGNELQKFLSSEKAISGIFEVYEVPQPKWYWPLVNIARRPNFFIYAMFSLMALAAIIVIITSVLTSRTVAR
jgi:hypothetical protein